MSNARRQAIEAAGTVEGITSAPDDSHQEPLLDYDEYVAIADAVSDVWEAVLRDVLAIASRGKICPSDAAVIARVRSALGE